MVAGDKGDQRAGRHWARARAHEFTRKTPEPRLRAPFTCTGALASAYRHSNRVTQMLQSQSRPWWPATKGTSAPVATGHARALDANGRRESARGWVWHPLATPGAPGARKRSQALPCAPRRSRWRSHATQALASVPRRSPSAPRRSQAPPGGSPATPQALPGRSQALPARPRALPGALQALPGAARRFQAPTGVPGRSPGAPTRCQAPPGVPRRPQALPGAPQAFPSAPGALLALPRAPPGAPELLGRVYPWRRPTGARRGQCSARLRVLLFGGAQHWRRPEFNLGARLTLAFRAILSTAVRDPSRGRASV